MAESPPIPASAYQIAWLCALPHNEKIAAILSLDERYVDASPVTKEYSYCYGRIGKYNVVIACLSPGETGNIATAQMIGPLKEHFENIEIFVLVGIAGGIPRKPTNTYEKHIRLGDVVVRQPSGSHSGVVNPTVGKYGPGGFEIKNSMDKAHPALRQACGDLTSELILSPNILKPFQDKLVKEPLLSRPKAKDVLFSANYEHQQCDDLENPCRNCAGGRQVRRTDGGSGNFECHFGSVISSDQLIKNAKLRDELALKVSDALCIEMEAGGSDAARCLVIRGIADYADSHKNKLWQGYAAANAAAVAKWIILNAKIRERGKDITASPVRGSPGYRDPNLELSDISDQSIKRFHGRNEILSRLQEIFVDKKLDQFTEATDVQCKIFVLHGRGGCGKTAICNKFYSKNRDQYWAAWRINASTEESLQKSFDNIAETVPGILDDTSQDSKQNVQRTVKWLKDQRRHWLLIFDNANDFKILRERYFPRSSYGSVLLTSRSKQALDRSTVGYEMLEVLGDEEASYALLKMILPTPEAVNDEPMQTHLEAKKVAKRLDYLPQGIVLAGSMIRNDDSDMTRTVGARLRDYLGALNQAPHPGHPLYAMWGPGQDECEELSLAEPYAMIVESMKSRAHRNGDHQLVEDALELLYFFSFLSSTGISLEIFTNYLKNTHVKHVTSATKATASLPESNMPSRLHRTSVRSINDNCSLSILAKSSETLEEKEKRIRDGLSLLISNDLIVWGGTVSLHSLVQDCARVSRFRNQDAGDQDAFRAIWTLVCSIPDIYDSTSRKYRRSLLPHIQAYRESYDDLAFAKIYLRLGFEEALEMHLCLAFVYSESGNFQTAMELQEVAVRKAKDQMNEYQDLFLRAQAQIATSYHDLNGSGQRLKALRLREDVRDRRNVKSTKSSVDLSIFNRKAYSAALSDLADSYEVFPELKFKALEIRGEVLDLCSKNAGEYDTREAKRRLARTCYEVGQRHRALELRENVFSSVQSEEESKGKSDSPDQFELVARSDLADSYCDQGLWIKATEWREQVVQQREVLLGESHYDTIAARSNLAISYSKMERYSEAIAQRELICKHFDDLFGPNHHETWQNYLELGRAYTTTDLVKALDIAIKVQKAADGVETSTGKKSSQAVMSAKETIAHVLEKMSKQADEWEKYFRKAVQLRTEVLNAKLELWGDRNNEVFVARGKLARCHSYNQESLRLAVEQGGDVCSLQWDRCQTEGIKPYENLELLSCLQDLAKSCERRADLFKKLDKGSMHSLQSMETDDDRLTASNRSEVGNGNHNHIQGRARESDGDESARSIAAIAPYVPSTERENTCTIPHECRGAEHDLPANPRSDRTDVTKEGSEWGDEDIEAQQNRLNDAELHWQTLLGIQKRRPNSDQEQATLSAMIDLANFYSRSDVERWDEAIQLVQPALKIMEQSDRLGLDHSITKSAKFRLVHLEQQNKRGLVSEWVAESSAHQCEMSKAPAPSP